MNKKHDLTRRKTVNQERIKKLIDMKGNLIKGITKGHLLLKNAPKEIRLRHDIVIKILNTKINNQTSVGAKDLILTFLVKVNLFASNFQTFFQDGYLLFTPYKNFQIHNWAEYLSSSSFDQKYPKIVQIIHQFWKSDPEKFKGLELDLLNPNYNLPKEVTIKKSALRRLCKEEGSKNVKYDLKKLYRGFTFFFNTRFNLINGTKKNRHILKFNLGEHIEMGNQDSVQWENLFNILRNNKNIDKGNSISWPQSNKSNNSPETQSIPTHDTPKNITNPYKRKPAIQFKTTHKKAKRVCNLDIQTIPRSFQTSIYNPDRNDSTVPCNGLDNRRDLQLNSDYVSQKLRKRQDLKNANESLSEEDMKFEIVHLLVHLKNIPNHQK
ncbi:hypothetical protein M0812_22985 [Anaeramoeba flamelloides]|uniref:Uncharacterized protein n=1 Tax=Anaeramoeba flamelloides TaxID=1746091 RepID=A0AAV7YPV2_9EUKA|nr:hypothetical protein M0812_22985 [Anaeramoeba flamelloides]